MDFIIVLVGPTGGGKSAFGNFILGREAFEVSKYNFTGIVTKYCERQKCALENGGTITVIDTPGFCNKQPTTFTEAERCFSLADNKIHAIFFVVSQRYPSSEKELEVDIRNMKTVFGKDVFDYMIAVIIDTVPATCSILYQETIKRLCRGRSISFCLSSVGVARGFPAKQFGRVNMDESSRKQGVQDMLYQVKTVISNNGGVPLMANLSKLQLQMGKTIKLEQLVEGLASTMNANKEQSTRIIDVVESSVKDASTRLEQQLAKENVMRLEADKRAREAHEKNLDEQMEKLREGLERAQKVHQTNSDEQMQKLKEELQRAQVVQQKNSYGQIAKLKEVFERAQEAQQKNSDEQMQKLVEELESAQEAQQKNFDEQFEKLKERFERGHEALENNSDGQIAKLKEVFDRAQEAQQKNSDKQIEKLQQVIDRQEVQQKNSNEQMQMLKEELERAQESQKNYDEQMQKLKEVLERAQVAQKTFDEQIQKLKDELEIAKGFESSSFHVYDPSSYLLQSGIN